MLSHSRKAYSEVMWCQDTESLIRGIENAFHHFGGVPKTLVPDNLKAAVLGHDWCDPTITPKFEAFARHYGVAVLPTKPRTPRHKGKVERCVAFAQDNALKGRQFASLAAQNELLRDWETKVADQRIHGTTRKQVHALFEADERHALLPLPAERFPLFHETQRTGASRRSHRDREGVLFGTARVPRATGVGALRLAPRAHLRSRALRDRAPRPRRSRPLQHRSRAHRRREDLRDRARHRVDARARGTHRRRERATRRRCCRIAASPASACCKASSGSRRSTPGKRSSARVCRAVASRVPTEDATSLARAAASSDAATRSSSTVIR
ncbi:MAG: IS21 family transposase [Planctomycetes bacterium]|nr:IS21 family transposase [Planctomycetota bacterium]